MCHGGRLHHLLCGGSGGVLWCVCVCVCVCLSDWVVAGLQGLVGVVMGLVGVVLLPVIGMVIKVWVLLQNHPVGGQR